MRFQMKGFMVFGMPLLAAFSLLIAGTGAGESPGNSSAGNVSINPGRFSVQPIADAWAKQYKLPSSFFKKGLMVEDILIATSGRISDHAILESAYLF